MISRKEKSSVLNGRISWVLILTSCNGGGFMLRRITMGREGIEGCLDLF